VGGKAELLRYGEHEHVLGVLTFIFVTTTPGIFHFMYLSFSSNCLFPLHQSVGTANLDSIVSEDPTSTTAKWQLFDVWNCYTEYEIACCQFYPREGREDLVPGLWFGDWAKISRQELKLLICSSCSIENARRRRNVDVRHDSRRHEHVEMKCI